MFLLRCEHALLNLLPKIKTLLEVLIVQFEVVWPKINIGTPGAAGDLFAVHATVGCGM